MVMTIDDDLHAASSWSPSPPPLKPTIAINFCYLIHKTSLAVVDRCRKAGDRDGRTGGGMADFVLTRQEGSKV